MKNEDRTIENKIIEYVPTGADSAIRLSVEMVKKFVAVPTKSGAEPNDSDCVKFLMLCRGKRANPFEGDCYMIGYDTARGPQFSVVSGIELFEKRAGADINYAGTESGVIVQNDEGITERAGTILLEGETLIGGWARVHRHDRTTPEYRTVALATYSTGVKRWEVDPAGMIMKVARSHALRAAFPHALGGLYTVEEIQKTVPSTVEEKPKIKMPKALRKKSEPQPKQKEITQKPKSETEEVEPQTDGQIDGQTEVT